ncbi:DUF3108 domain-containing protein [Candidatus Poribacteria bacterium]|nr:DUF3108 domain-containing protein [Candidatus Poribacteria bacterium]
MEFEPCQSHNFIFNLNLIAPPQLGVRHWEIGDYARYRHRRKRSVHYDKLDREIGYHIIGALEISGDQGYWLKQTGFYYFRTIPRDIYRWVKLHDLRTTRGGMDYEYLQNYIPFRVEFCEQSDVPFAKLLKLGEERIETEAGTFECIHYRAELTELNREVLEIWVSPAISPLGIVRAQSENDILELISFGQNKEITIPKLIQPVIEGISTLDYGCNSCHGYETCHESIFPPR